MSKRVQDAVQPIVKKHRLIEILNAAAFDPALVACRRERNERKLAEELGIASPTPTTQALVHFCPGVSGSVSVNAQHPLATKLEGALRDPAFAERYRSARGAFGSYLDSHPSSTVDERNAELSRLMAPVREQMNGVSSPPPAESGASEATANHPRP